MSRLSRIFGVTRRSQVSASDADEGLVSDNAEVFEDSSRDTSDDKSDQWGDWSHHSDNDLHYVEALNKHEASMASVSSSGSHSGHRREKGASNSSMTDTGQPDMVSPKKDKEKHRKDKKRTKSDSSPGMLDVSGALHTSPGDAMSEQEIRALHELKKARKREKRHDEMAKSSRREKKGDEKKRRSKLDGSVGSLLPPSNDTERPDHPRSPSHRPSSSRQKHRSRSHSRNSTRPTRAHSADPAMAGSSYSSSKDSSSRRRRDGSKRESMSRTKRDSKDTDKKKPSSRSKRASVDSTSKVELNLLGGSDVALDAALMTPSFSSSEATGTGGADQQRQEILRLHQMLSDALQKVATQSAEQIYDKDMLMKVNGELARLRADFELAQRAKKEFKAQLDERDRNIEKFVGQIDSLTESLERQRAEQSLVEADLEQSEADVDKLLIKIEDLERAVDDSGNVTDETLRAELKEAKIAMVDKKREAERRKNRIEELEKEVEEQNSRLKELGRELEEIVTVNKLQISELEDEITGLQGKLKGERLDSSSKFTAQEARITLLEQELARYRGKSEYEEIAVVRKEREEAQHALEAATQELEAAKNTLTKFKAEKEDLVERNTKLNMEVKSWEKRAKDFNAKSAELEQRVLKWTEQTYEWKSKAESAERKLSAMSDGNSEIISDSGSTAEEAAPQGLFLQAAMDKKESSRKSNNMWSLFSRTGLGEEDQTAEEIRIRGLEEQNQGLQEKNSELQSELVKIQSAHKEEMYNKQKLLAHLKDENEALKVKTKTLETLCGGDIELST